MFKRAPRGRGARKASAAQQAQQCWLAESAMEVDSRGSTPLLFTTNESADVREVDTELLVVRT